MHKVDVKELHPFLLRRLKRGEAVVVTKDGDDLCAVIPMDLLNLLEGLQLESLEEEDSVAVDEIQSILRVVSQQNN